MLFNTKKSQVTNRSKLPKQSAAFQQEDVSSYQNRSMSAAFQHEDVSSYQNRSMSAAFLNQNEDESAFQHVLTKTEV